MLEELSTYTKEVQQTTSACPWIQSTLSLTRLESETTTISSELSINIHYKDPMIMHACVDRGQESLPGSQANTDGALFYHVETSCNGMPCPPYDPPNERFTAT